MCGYNGAPSPPPQRMQTVSLTNSVTSHLSNTSATVVNSKETGFVAASNLLELLASKRSPSEIEWQGDAADLFASLRIIILLLLAEFPASQRRLQNPSILYRLLGNAWELLHNTEKLRQIISSSRPRSANGLSTFTYLVQTCYPYDCPKFLRRYTESHNS